MRRWLPGRWRWWLLQILVLIAVDAIYETTRALVEGDATIAFAHARNIVSLEQALGIFHERDWQVFGDGLPRWIVELTNWTYHNCMRLISWSFILWLLFRRPTAFPRVRNTIIVLDIIGVLGDLLYPTAPPRLTTAYGFVDTLDPTHANLRSSLFGPLTNLYAAVPSLHSAYAILLGATGVMVGRHLLTRVVWGLYPVLVIWSTVATGNHWFLDVAGGVAALAIAWPLAGRALRWRAAMAPFPDLS